MGWGESGAGALSGDLGDTAVSRDGGCSQGGGQETSVEFSLVSEHIFLYKQWILCYFSSTFLKTQLPCYGGTDDESPPQ